MKLRPLILAGVSTAVHLLLTPVPVYPHAAAQDVRITADMNRDGRVDFAMDWDQEVHQTEWLPERGGIFLNNADSSMSTGAPDNADQIVNGPDDLKDLATVKISRSRRFPQAATLTLSVDEASRNRVRIFQKIGEDFVAVDLNAEGNVDKSRIRAEDLELRIESLSFRSKDWNGTVTLRATMKDGDRRTEYDETYLRVAPFILLSNLQEGLEVYTREFPGRNDRFIEQLKEIVPKAGAELRIVPAQGYPEHNIWLQDAMEIGYTESPDNRMQAVLKANRNKPLDNYPKDALLGPGFAWFEVGEYRPEFGAGDGGKSWLDWYGNLEVSPPFEGYPMGRAYFGKAGDASLNPDIVAMIDAQEVQGPAVGLNVDWLLIKHVDEAVCFLPGGKVLVPDFPAMKAVLESAPGDAAMLDGTKTPAAILADELLMTHNDNTQQRIDEMTADLKKEFKIADADVIRVPALFRQDGGSLVPNLVNSLVLNGHLLAADPRGPMVNGEDMLQKKLKELLAGLPLEVHFLDDAAYHAWNGNVHCATNVRRKGLEEWWSIMRPAEQKAGQ